MTSEDGLTAEEIWLQDSEARLESMEMLLKSVRRDIDALSEKLPSPRPGLRMASPEDEPVVHESGSKDYIVKLERRPRSYRNLGLGSHTMLEPFDDEDDFDVADSASFPLKSWRSPSDFRPSKGSPPGSPTFGESSNIISFNDVIIDTENNFPTSTESANFEVKKLIPIIGSQHSLPTIEENSQEDNTETSSISTSEDLKSADYAFDQHFQSAVCCATSSDTLIDPQQRARSKCSLNEMAMNSRLESEGNIQSPLRSLSPHTGGNHEGLGFSRTSLRSRDSMVSETDSFVTVNSQLFPSGEEAYVTACSDNDGMDDFGDEGSIRGFESTRRSVLVLQQAPTTDDASQSDDVLEFTFVERPLSRTKNTNRKDTEDFMEIPKDSKKLQKRRALRKRRPDDMPKENHDEGSDEDENDTSSSSNFEEAVYDAVSAKVVEGIGAELPQHIDRCERLTYLEETNCMSNSLDSPDELDIVVHYDEAGNYGGLTEVQIEGIGPQIGTEEGQEKSFVHKTPGPDIKAHQDNTLGKTVPKVTVVLLKLAPDSEDKCNRLSQSMDVTRSMNGKSIPAAESERYADTYKSYKVESCGVNHEVPSTSNATIVRTNANFLSSNSPYLSRTDGSDVLEMRQPSFAPRADLPQCRLEDFSRRARRDYFNEAASPAAFYVGETAQGIYERPAPSPTVQPNVERKSTQRSKSVSRPLESDGVLNGRDYVAAAGARDTPSGRMYRRSCSRYRSTDIDVALAKTTVSRENLLDSPFQESPTTKKMASSLFDLSARRQLSVSNSLHVVSKKSTNSLLETDIDTGEQKNQQIILETDVDTLNTYRLVGDFAPANQGLIHSANDKAYSLFNLNYNNTPGQLRKNKPDESQHQSRSDAYKRAQSLSGISRSVNYQSSESRSGASGLVARLRARARSNHELRVAESLTRIQVPEWLDKADFSKPISSSHRSTSTSPTRLKNTLSNYAASLPSAIPVQGLLNNTFELRGRIGVKTVETVTKPLYLSKTQSNNVSRRPLRPSQILRERNASAGPKLTPIKSSLRSSMKSQVKEGSRTDNGALIRTETAAFRPVHLTPDDFVPRNVKVWGDKPNYQGVPLPSAQLVQAPKPKVTASFSSASSSSASLLKHPSRKGLITRSNGHSKSDEADSNIQMVDSSSIVENQLYQPMEATEVKRCVNHLREEEDIYEEVQPVAKIAPPPLSIPRSSPSCSFASTQNSSSNHCTPSLRNADSDGDTETAATDGLDNISDLTCLTDLLDKFSARHLHLLQNRPSALEHILAQFGWWSQSSNTSFKNQNLRGSEDCVALAAAHFNPDEDSHRNEFLALLNSPAGQGPLILTEFGFDQKRIGLDRNPKDGMLYLHCSNSSCPRLGPTRIDRARSWRTCTNCFTAYCSTKCREQAIPTHNMVCSFGRIRLGCGRILHNLAPSQQASLTALAKAGATRLGRGGILITFASVQDAEFFLARSADPVESRRPSEPTCGNRPSPSGLMAPPIYLTVDELSRLDSRLAAPCKTYKPSTSYVLIVIVCAYDLETTRNGRAVHLYKQCIVLPFPMTAVQPVQLQQNDQKVSYPSYGLPQSSFKEDREAYLKRLQRTLRERGISLRNSEPEIYKMLARFVETGEVFEPVEFDFHDYYSNQTLRCSIAPMKDVLIREYLNLKAKSTQEPHMQTRNRVRGKASSFSRPQIGETEL